MRDCAFDVYKEISYLMKNIPIKKLLAAVIAAGTLAGAVFIATDYADGSNFHPFKSSRALLANQVFFPDNDNTASYNGTDKTEDDNSFWEEDKSSEQTDRPESQNDAGYLFEQSSLMYPDSTVAAGTQNQDAAGSLSMTGRPYTGNADNENIFDITGDRQNADVIISGSGVSGRNDAETGKNESISGGTSGSIRGSGSGSSGSGAGAAGGGGAAGGTGGNTSGETGTTGGTETSDKPDNGGSNNDNRTPADTARDPVPDKKIPSDPWFPSREFEADRFPGLYRDDETSVSIGKPFDSESELLYSGQFVNEQNIFSALDTHVTGNDFNLYYWMNADYGKFIRISAVSFDGINWISDFPVRIPSELKDNILYIKAEWRLKTNAPWNEKIVQYEVESSKIYLLSDTVKGENSEINSDDIIYSAYVQDGGILNTLSFFCIYKYLGTDRLMSLFPGWAENGKPVPWFYKSSHGRHILEPRDMVPIDDKYTVNLDMYYLNDDYSFDESRAGNACYLQTLENYSMFDFFMQQDAHTLNLDDAFDASVFNVPKYIQAVDISPFALLLPFNYVNIPDTVFYVNTSDSGLTVLDGYNVDAANPVLTSENGILYNKNKTKIIGVPKNETELVIPDTVKTVVIPYNSNIRRIVFGADNYKYFPEFSGNVTDCQFVMDINTMEDFFYGHYADLMNDKENYVSSSDDPDTEYTVINGAIVSRNSVDQDKDGSVYRALDINMPTLKLTNEIKSVQGAAFADVKSVNEIILPDSGEPVDFEFGSLTFSSVDTIICKSERQYNSLKAQLEKTIIVDGRECPWTGIEPEKIKLIYANETKNGCRYMIDEGDDGKKTVTLLSVPDDITDFDGTIFTSDGEELTVNIIGDYAFEGARDLKWVTLPEETYSVGYRAFADCTGLQGVLIDNNDKITIGNDAFTGCSSIRFIASNAKSCEMLNGYEPNIVDYHGNETFFIRPDATGYGRYCNNLYLFEGIKSIDRYELSKLDSTSQADSRILYADIDENDTLLIKTSEILPENLSIPERVTGIYPYGMADTYADSETGEFTINWDELDKLYGLNAGAFYNSGLSGDVNISLADNYVLYLGDNLFSLSNIESINFASDIKSMGNYMFMSCDRLKNATFNGILKGAEFPNRTFSGCGDLEEIRFMKDIPELYIIYTGYEFNFCDGENYKIVIPETELKDSDAESFEDAVRHIVRVWEYPFSGGSYYTNTSPQFDFWSSMQKKLRNGSVWPTDKEVDSAVYEALLKSENRIRGLLGADTVEEPTNFFPLKTVGDKGILYLKGAPSYLTELSLDGESLWMPAWWTIDYICTDTFINSSNLTRLTVPVFDAEDGNYYSLTGMEPDAFRIKDYDKVLTVEFESREPALMTLTSIYDRVSNDSVDTSDKEDSNYYNGMSEMPDDNSPDIEMIFDDTSGIDNVFERSNKKDNTAASDVQKSDTAPYEFGLDDDQLCFIVPDGCEITYLKKWMYPLLGYEDAGSMYDKIKAGALLKDDYHIVEEMSSELTEPAVRLSRMIEGIDPDSIDQDKLKELICDDLGIDVSEEAPEATPSDYPRATETEYQEQKTETEEAAEVADIEKDNNSSDKEASDKDSTGTDSDKSDKDTSDTDGTGSDKADKSDNVGEGGKNETTSDADYAESDAKGASGEISSDTDDTIEDSASKDTADIIAKETLTGKNGSSKNKDIGSSDENVIEKIASFISGELRKLSKLCA